MYISYIHIIYCICIYVYKLYLMIWKFPTKPIAVGFFSCKAATQLSALLRSAEALARYSAQRRVAVALQCGMRQKWQRKKYLVTRQY